MQENKLRTLRLKLAKRYPNISQNFAKSRKHDKVTLANKLGALLKMSRLSSLAISDKKATLTEYKTEENW